MNGTEQTILDAIKENGKNISKIYTKIEGAIVKQDLQHKENGRAIKKIEKRCDGMMNHKGQIIAQWVVISFIIAGLIGMWLKKGG